MSMFLAGTGFDAVVARGIDDRDETDNAAVAFRPAPGEGGEGDALACDFVDITADIFETADAVRQNGVVARFPFREVLDHPASGELEVFLIYPRYEAVRGTWTVGTNRGGKRVIERLRIRARHLDLLVDKPLARLFVKAWRVAVVMHIIAIVFVPPRVDYDDIALTNLRAGILQILGSNYFPFLLGNGHNHARSKEIGKWDLVHKWRPFNDMRRRVDVRARMHDGSDALR